MRDLSVQATPALELEVLGVEPALHVASPALHFRLRAKESAQRDVYMVALSTQVHIDPGLRGHDPGTRERLVDLFGTPERWASTTTSIVWARVETLLPSFTAEAEFTLVVPCTYDLEVAFAKYLDALPDGEVPLSFHFSGRIFYRGEDGRLQIVLTPWTSAVYRMPVAVWRSMIDHHFPGSGFMRLQEDTLRALALYKAQQGIPTFDGAIADLLGRVAP
ncbi:MAG: hypothetical protein QOH15_3078 [Gaiellales bacterium]|jgi:hypothetical protein|nr:hypothetical protein [Gaiellales bacterium]